MATRVDPLSPPVGRNITLPDLNIATTPEIHRWLTKIEDAISDVCTIVREATSKLNSEQKQKISALCTNVLGASSHMALNYQMIKQKYISANTEMEVMYNDNVRDNVIATQFEDIKNCVKAVTSAATSVQNASYSGIVKKGKDSVIFPPSTATIAIYPDNKEQQSEQTKKIVQEIIKPEKMQLHIRGVWNTKNGGVIISSDQKNDIEKLKKSEQLIASGLKVEETTKRRPKIILMGVPSDISELDLYECLYEQNIAGKKLSIDRELFKKSVRLSHKSGRKEVPYCNYILEVTAEIRKMLILQDRVFINWSSCRVRDYTHITRCFQCQQYGHSAKHCRDTDPTCGHCGSLGHPMKDCIAKAQPAKCATCTRFKKPSNHKTGDEKCPARKIAEDRYLRSTDYA